MEIKRNEGSMKFEDREDVKEAIATGHRASDLLQDACDELREKEALIVELKKENAVKDKMISGGG
jgi:hypothetical protein